MKNRYVFSGGLVLATVLLIFKGPGILKKASSSFEVFNKKNEAVIINPNDYVYPFFAIKSEGMYVVDKNLFKDFFKKKKDLKIPHAKKLTPLLIERNIVFKSKSIANKFKTFLNDVRAKKIVDVYKTEKAFEDEISVALLDSALEFYDPIDKQPYKEQEIKPYDQSDINLTIKEKTKNSGLSEYKVFFTSIIQGILEQYYEKNSALNTVNQQDNFVNMINSLINNTSLINFIEAISDVLDPEYAIEQNEFELKNKIKSLLEKIQQPKLL